MAANSPSNGQYAIKSISSVGHKLYLSENFADFHFIFKSKPDDGSFERIPVHKMILATTSDVFQVMFNGSWKEKVDVEIVDVSAEVFKEFLQFFYLSEANLTSENVAVVMNLGKMYNVTECFDVCGQFLMDHLTDDDIWVIYELAAHLEYKELEKQCVEYIKRNARTIFTTETFLNCEPKVVQKILQMNSLVCPEVEIFEGLMKWMNAKIESTELTQEIVQGRFGDLLHEIRFGSMTFDEFASLDPMYGALFTLEEHREIIRMIHSEQFRPEIFKSNRRNHFGLDDWNKDAAIHCERYIKWSKMPYIIKNIETTTFTVNKPVALGAFTCSPIFRFVGDKSERVEEQPHPSIFNPVGNKFEHLEEVPQAEIIIFKISGPENLNRKVCLYKGKQMYKPIGSTDVNLPSPIVIRPEIKYEIQIEMQLTSTENLCTRIIFKREVHMEPDITVKFHDETITDDEARGLISKLSFNKI